MERLRAFWNKGWMGKVVLGVGGLLAFCCVASVVVTALSPRSAPTAQAPASAATTAPAQVAPAAQATAAPEPTSALAPTAAPEPTAMPAAPSTGAVGDRLEVGGIALTVVKAERADKIGDFQKAQAGNVLIVIEAIIENVDTSAGDYNPFYFKIKDDAGFEYTATINTDTQGLKAGTLAKGEKARGTIVIEVKKDAKGLILSYAPLALSLSGEPIKVALP